MTYVNTSDIESMVVFFDYKYYQNQKEILLIFKTKFRKISMISSRHPQHDEIISNDFFIEEI